MAPTTHHGEHVIDHDPTDTRQREASTSTATLRAHNQLYSSDSMPTRVRRISAATHGDLPRIRVTVRGALPARARPNVVGGCGDVKRCHTIADKDHPIRDASVLVIAQ
ncbi:hypothetical protein [Alloactinosynnema sp. L-07]|nr:hypothetical protein [Alloactinosynnema sp. L-07]